MDQGIMALQNSGRGEDTRLAHLMQGEVVVPPHILARNKSLKKALERHLAKTGTNLSDITVGSGSINPNTGLEEFGFLSKLWKKVKKVIDPVAKVARFIPGPIGTAANVYLVGKTAINVAKGEQDPKALLREGLKTYMFTGTGKFGGRAREGIESLIGGGPEVVAGGETAVSTGDPFLDMVSNRTKNPFSPDSIGERVQDYFSGIGSYDPTTGKGQSKLGIIEDLLKGGTDALKSGLGSLGEGFGNLTGLDPRLALLSAAYGKATEKALEKESGGMQDITKSIRPDLAYNTYGGIGGFDIGFAEGGEVMDMRNGGESVGPGTGTSDDIPAMLSDGEFVMTAKANLGAGSVGLKKGKGGIMELVPQGEPDRQRGADNMMTLMRYFEARA